MQKSATAHAQYGSVLRFDTYYVDVGQYGKLLHKCVEYCPSWCLLPSLAGAPYNFIG